MEIETLSGMDKVALFVGKLVIRSAAFYAVVFVLGPIIKKGITVNINYTTPEKKLQ